MQPDTPALVDMRPAAYRRLRRLLRPSQSVHDRLTAGLVLLALVVVVALVVVMLRSVP